MSLLNSGCVAVEGAEGLAWGSVATRTLQLVDGYTATNTPQRNTLTPLLIRTEHIYKSTPLCSRI
ncbi:hypothetical protein E2C01_052950 [Portunus trituberculatus]|uniref:Uncharacterized protein n=1 Tax=Portunus trituberculatus TaxID=210409 RepID=A0A5B7GN62_PORTR|nr:hypothetical protein [Portunus trituberculatus]